MKEHIDVYDILFTEPLTSNNSPLFEKQAELAEVVVSSSSSFRSVESMRAMLSKVFSKSKNPSLKLRKAISLAVEKRIDQLLESGELKPNKKSSILLRINESFKQTNKTYSQNSNDVLTIASGFILFSAPIAAIRNNSRNHARFKITFLGEDDDQDVHQPIFNEIGEPNGHKLYNANDLMHMLEKKLVDAICVATPIYDNKKSSFTSLIPVKVCTIANTQHSGIYLQIFSKDFDTKTLKNLSINEILQYLKSHVKKTGNTIPLFYFDNTLSEIHLERILLSNINEDIESIFSTVLVNEENQTLKEQPFTRWENDNLEVEMEGDINTCAFIGWQPYLSKYLDLLNSEINCNYTDIKIPIEQILPPNSLPHFEFSLVVRKDFLDSETGMSLVQDFIQLIKEAIDNIEGRAYRRSLSFRKIAESFGTTIDVLESDLNKTNFDIKYYPEYLTYLTNRKQP